MGSVEELTVDLVMGEQAMRDAAKELRRLQQRGDLAGDVAAAVFVGVKAAP